jgi:uncharacterized membrane protein
MHTEIAANPGNLLEMAQQLKLSDVAYARALELAGLTPSRKDWRVYIDRFLLSLGALLIVAGIAAFFAWNWAELGRFAKFALIEGGILATVILTWRFGIDSLAGRIGLLSSAFLIGTLLAVFGQTYQTGADPYGLFLTWALLILPWALIGRQSGLWILLQLLLNLTLIMYYTQVLHPPSGWWQLSQLLGPLVWLASTMMDSTLASYLFGLNLVALALWEFGTWRGVAWMQGTVFARLFAFVALCTLVVPTLLIIVAAGFEAQTELGVVSPLLLILATGIALYYYQYRRYDLLILTCALFGMILVVTVFVIRHLVLDPGSLLLIAILIVAQVAAAAWWLRRVAQRREAGA